LLSQQGVRQVRPSDELRLPMRTLWSSPNEATHSPPRREVAWSVWPQALPTAARRMGARGAESHLFGQRWLSTRRAILLPIDVYQCF
jgi:hypothetical protein